jgi:predicted PurR-regulated permease PerM
VTGGEQSTDGARRVVLLPRTLVILLELAAAVVVVAGIRSAAWLVGPVFLALVIVITVHPLAARLRDRGLPGWAATTLLVLLVYGVLLVLAGVVVVSLARLATLLPSYAPQFNDLLASITAELARFGVGPAQLRAIVGALDYGRLVAVVSGLLLGLTGLLGNLVFLLSLLLFLSIEASGAGHRLALIARDRAPIAVALGGSSGPPAATWA